MSQRPSTEQLARPGRWPCRVVTAATWALPRGPVRDRYRQELVAELYGISRHQQVRSAIGVLTHCWALRRAITKQGSPRKEAIMPTRPVLCRLNVRHVWHTERTEDGERFRRCLKCGKDASGVPRGPAGIAYY